MTQHDLKTWPEPFQATMDGNKPWEIRKNDRNYQLGDTLRLREWVPEGDPVCVVEFANEYTGREIVTDPVSYILYGPNYGIPDGYCIMSTAPVQQPGAASAKEHNRSRALALAALEHGVAVMIWRGAYSPCHDDHPTDRRLAGLGSFKSPFDALAAAAVILRLQPGPVPPEYEQSPTAVEALQHIAHASANWHVGVGYYAGGETYAGFAGRLQRIARDALAALPAHESNLAPQDRRPEIE